MTKPPEPAAHVRDLMPQALDELERLVRIPSVAFDGFPWEPVTEAAELTAELFSHAGVETRLIQMPVGAPFVYGELAGATGAPTVLLYAHYDVQPAGELADWDTPPFEPVRADGRLFGRGSSDDKSGIVGHLAAIRAFDGSPPVTIKVVIEGEEETGASNLETYVPEHQDLFDADVMVVADMGNRTLGVPALVTSLRGMAVMTIEVQTLEKEVHSGYFGGPAPDAFVALTKILATLHDDQGNVTVDGLEPGRWDGAEVDEAAFRENAGVLDGVGLIASGGVGERLWSGPSINVIGIDAPPVEGARNVLLHRVRARLAIRVPPGEDPVRAEHLIVEHLRGVTPWNATVGIDSGNVGAGFTAPTGGRGFAAARAAMREAYGGVEPELIGSGASIPLLEVLHRAVPAAEFVLWGTEEPKANVHAPNESVDLRELERITLAEVLLIGGLGSATPSAAGS
ncbi:MAG: M20/M25/M40 family metallo-hydrolase [Actinomycetota bacterium]